MSLLFDIRGIIRTIRLERWSRITLIRLLGSFKNNTTRTVACARAFGMCRATKRTTRDTVIIRRMTREEIDIGLRNVEVVA